MLRNCPHTKQVVAPTTNKYVRGSPSVLPCLFLICTQAGFLCAEEPLETSLLQASRSVLPFQAVRFQLIWKNTGTKDFRPRLHLDSGFNVWEIKRPGESKFTRFKSPVLDASGVSIDASTPYVNEPLVFKPGERLSISWCMAAEWSDSQSAEPLFTKPGKYQITVRWAELGRDGQDITDPKPIIVTIDEPRGEDVAIMQDLANDQELLGALLSPINVPHPKTLAPRLTDFIAKHLNSSYSDYARFALARSVAGVEYLENPFTVGRNRKEKALALLQGIDIKNFAYGPEALVFQRRLYESLDDQELTARSARRLDLLFPDDGARLKDLTRRLTPEQWAAQAPRAPRPDK